MHDLPLITITMGDPAGIGPEIILKTLLRDDIYKVCSPIVLGDIDVLKMVSKKIGSLSFNVIATPSQVTGNPGLVDVISVSNLKRDSFIPGQPTVDGGKAMVDYIVKAVDLDKDDQVSAMVTCPINKELMRRAGYRFDGHTELLAKLTNTKDYVMMLVGDRLRVSLVTIHCTLKEVPQRLNKGLILKTIKITYRALEEDFAIKRPHVAVAGLNPHAGEAGLFGLEDKEIIRPAVEEAKDDGLLVDGPFPPDTIFYHAINGKFDAVVAMYHDQGLIPVKLLNFSDSVNITLGLPIIRTSVDHGTAYDIAGKGVADPSSLIAAIKMATRIASGRLKAQTKG
ncbi:MAG: 4-hydroxythreonine-4-phosphate dehydrogenase PdxA [Desulfobacteraceae bacterium]|nr:MAG: 4-hydroxythreonine-4-phosphate dehydrogenase PdxA [Desulfobacteraceae bacterium]